MSPTSAQRDMMHLPSIRPPSIKRSRPVDESRINVYRYTQYLYRCMFLRTTYPYIS